MQKLSHSLIALSSLILLASCQTQQETKETPQPLTSEQLVIDTLVPPVPQPDTTLPPVLPKKKRL